MRKILPFLLVLLCPFLLNAQTNNDPVYLNYTFFPNRDFEEIEGNGTYQMMEANMILPGFNLGKNTIVYTNLNYKGSFYNLEEGQTNTFPNQLTDVRLGFIVRHTLADHWEAILAPRLNLRTDFEEDLTKRDIFPSVHLLGLRTSKKNENLIYGLGISYNNEATKNLVIPLAFFQYQTEKFRIYTIIPSFAYFMMTPSEKFEYGLSLNLESGMYHVKRFDENGSPNYLRTQNITIAPTIGYSFAKNFWFNMKAGYGLPGKYQFMDADFEDMEFTKDNTFKGGFFINGGISLRVGEKKKDAN